MTKRALITGITGQDGSYLAELLLAKGYEVHGVIRRSSSFNTGRIDSIFEDPHKPGARLRLHYGDVTDGTGLRRIIEKVQPDEVYNLAAQSHVMVSFQQAEYTVDVVATGTLRMLEAVRDHAARANRPVRFYQAGSSEMFGSAPARQNERTPFEPRSPYACAKVFAHHQVANHREAYNLFAVNGILFNHESPRRGETFVTRKITRAATRIKLGLQDKLYLGNLDARRDWGFAGEYVEAMWRMLQQDRPDDHVIATGESWSVRDFAENVFGELGLDLQQHLVIDPRYFRPSDPHHLEGDASRAADALGWRPKVKIKELASRMIESDMRLARQERTLVDAGHEVRMERHDWGEPVPTSRRP